MTSQYLHQPVRSILAATLESADSGPDKLRTLVASAVGLFEAYEDVPGTMVRIDSIKIWLEHARRELNLDD